MLNYALLQQAGNGLIQLWTVLFQNLPAIITALVGGLAWWSARKAAAAAKQADATTKQTQVKVDEVKKDTGTVIEKTGEIHTQVNSNLAEVREELKVSNKSNEGLRDALIEAARQSARLEEMVRSLLPVKGQQSPSESNGEKLDNLQTMLSNVQSGTPPIPVKDEAVLEQLKEVVNRKLDTIQETVDHPAPEEKKNG